MNELKPEDVMRALECCIKTQCENCCNLGSWHEQWNCMTDLMKKALALLREREKDAEIEKLRKDIAAYQKSTIYWHKRWIEAASQLDEYADMLMEEMDED